MPAAPAPPARPAPGALRRRYVADVLQRVRARRHYPAPARRRGIEGTVRVRFRVRADGTVEGLAADGGHRLLRLAALAAVRRAAPFPAPPAGLGAPVTVRYTMAFRLREGAAD